jgi:Swiss Army Knife protein, DSP-PTPase phosphatase domain
LHLLAVESSLNALSRAWFLMLPMSLNESPNEPISLPIALTCLLNSATSSVGSAAASCSALLSVACTRWNAATSYCWTKGFQLPTDEKDAFSAFLEAWHRAERGDIVDVACDGGTGRTGTAVACLAVLAGVEPDAAVTWVRANYHPFAIEVPEQEALIPRFANWLANQQG